MVLAQLSFWPLSKNQGEFERVYAASIAPLLEQAERLLLEAALERAGGNRRQAARLLGVDRKQVERRLQKYGLDGSKLT